MTLGGSGTMGSGTVTGALPVYTPDGGIAAGSKAAQGVLSGTTQLL